MHERLCDLLDHLTAQIDFDELDRIRDRYCKSLRWEPVDRPPLSMTYPLPENCPFQTYPHREVFDDPEKMLYNELVHGFRTSAVCHPGVGDDMSYSVRANFGTGVISSLFGAKIEQVGDQPPWVMPLESDVYERVLDLDPLDFDRGWCPRVVQTYDSYRELLSGYPELEKAISITLPDLQGPFDNAELLSGSDLFLDVYDGKEEMSHLLNHLARAQVGFANRLKPLVREPLPGFAHQHGLIISGNILIRNDSSIMMSAELYGEYVAPHDRFVLKGCGGGGIHSCGNISHLLEHYLELPELSTLDFGQADMNDLDKVYVQARNRKVALIRIKVPEEQLLSGEVINRFPTGVALRHHAESIDAARRIFESYHRNGR